MTTVPSNLLQYLEFVARVAGGNRRSCMKYGSYEELVLTEGQTFEQLTPIPTFKRGTMGECFRNSMLYVIENRAMTYCEGWAVSDRLPIPLQHAWVINEKGKVIDPTWDDEAAYFGVPFLTEFVIEFATNTGYYGILGNDWMNDCALLAHGTEGKVKCLSST